MNHGDTSQCGFQYWLYYNLCRNQIDGVLRMPILFITLFFSQNNMSIEQILNYNMSQSCKGFTTAPLCNSQPFREVKNYIQLSIHWIQEYFEGKRKSFSLNEENSIVFMNKNDLIDQRNWFVPTVDEVFVSKGSRRNCHRALKWLLLLNWNP